MFRGIYLTSLLIFMLALHCECTSISLNETNNHMCSRIERYTEEIVDIYHETFLEPYTVYCFSFPPRCTRYREAIREINKTISVPKTKTVFECCEGFVKKNGECSAICPNGCVHGKCFKPKTCLCDEGWRGHDCTIECDDGWYGEECQMYCTCQNGATCDKKNGFCHCPPGFAGTFCESICPRESHGNKCHNLCLCKNGGVCSLVDDTCECPPGYIGGHCEKPCEDGTFGDECLNNCSCSDLATIFCSHVDGKCFCVPGWKGDACSSKCDLNTWGPQCSKKCDCPPNAICDHVTGKCSCQPGWQGLLCEKKCEDGYFGKDCKKKCPDCMYLPGICHYVTGQCSCPAGSRGSNCDLECPENTYGESCINECSCSNNSSCDPENGACICLPGWMGENCSIPCEDGMYGLNCSFFCNCSENCTCNQVDGECMCEDYNCTNHYISEIGKDTSLDESESSLDLLIILLVACIVLGILLFFSFVFCITKRAKKSRSRLRKEENSMTNVIPENSSPSISSFHFMNPNYDTLGNTEMLNEKSAHSFSSENNVAVKKEEKELELEEEFCIPDCGTGSPLEKQNINILFRNGLTKEGEKENNSIPEIRYSKTGESCANADGDDSSQTNSLYADVEYKNEDHSESSQNPPEVEEVER